MARMVEVKLTVFNFLLWGRKGKKDLETVAKGFGTVFHAPFA